MGAETAENTALWMVPPGSLSLSYTTQARPPRDSASHSGPGPRTSMKLRKCFRDMAISQCDLDNSPNELPSPGD